jgi:calcineurin-like phosphoesterase family protein
MGATASVIANSDIRTKNIISCLLLWVPDPKSTVNIDFNTIYEEEGQKYKGAFWKEAKDAQFFDCLNNFKGKIHLVYGEHDKYIAPALRQQVIDAVNTKGSVLILKDQDHSKWSYDSAQEVYKQELSFLQKNFT